MASGPAWIGAPPSEDIVRILVGTDQHIGYKSRDSIRMWDSLKSFRELLHIAKAQKVDFVLLGGDLFDVNKPPRVFKHEVIRTLRKAVLGPEPVSLQFRSDPSLNFWHSKFARVNYEDPNLNIGLPIFAIHGNHDDMAGGELCALDELHETGLINLFGKVESVSEYELNPLLLQKGRTKIALYGLGAQKDERLATAFHKGKVVFNQPSEEAESWANLFVLHQTRTDYSRDRKNFINETVLPHFLHLTIWGHEHKAMINPELPDDEKEPRKLHGRGNDQNLGWVMQPGSSVATSLDKAEAGPKFVSLLEVKGTQWKQTPIKLKSVRQFLIGEEIRMADHKEEIGFLGVDRDGRNDKLMMELCEGRVQALVDQAAEEWNKVQPKLPLIRIRVDFAGCGTPFNVREFGCRFVGKVANPSDLILAFNSDKDRKLKTGGVNMATLKELSERNRIDQHASVEDFVESYFQEHAMKEAAGESDGSDGLSVLTPSCCSRAASLFIHDEEGATASMASFSAIINFQEEKIAKVLAMQDGASTEEEDVRATLAQLRGVRLEMERRKDENKEPGEEAEAGGNLTLADLNITDAEIEAAVWGGGGPPKSQRAADVSLGGLSAMPAPSSRGRGRGRGRGAKTSTQLAPSAGNISAFFGNTSALEGRDALGSQSLRPPSSTASTKTQPRASSKRATEDEDDDEFATAVPPSQLRGQNAKRESSSSPSSSDLGGERVLWAALRALQQRYAGVRWLVYTGDAPAVAPAEMLGKARERFGICLEAGSVEFVPLATRGWLEASRYPVATLFGQTFVGGLIVALEAALRATPHVMIDTMGCPITLPVFRLLAGSTVACYVHYPTISRDMLGRVAERTAAYNNSGAVAASPLLSRLKLGYYWLFAGAYALIGRASQATLVNSSWTLGHIRALWGGAPTVVFPPCDVDAFRALEGSATLKSESEPELRMLSVGQFRPEKDHRLQLSAFARFLQRWTAEGAEGRRPLLVLAGSCRNAEDEARVEALKAEAARLGIPDHHLEWRLNVPFGELKAEIGRATIGIHSMWNEHFGIAVVEQMAGGNIMIAHNSGGPKMDIVGDGSGPECLGYLASSAEEYAEAMGTVAALSREERDAIRERARASTARYSDAVFDKEFTAACSFIDAIL